MADSSADGSKSRSGASKKKNAIHGSKEQKKIHELNDGLDFLSKRLSRRQAISTGVGVAAGVIGGLAVGAAAGYLVKPSTTSTETTTSTTTVSSPPVTSTITSTITQTPTISTTSSISSTTSSISSSLSSISSSTTGGPGIDYYYDPSLKGLTVNYVAGGSVEHVTIDPTFALFTKETGITVNENLTQSCVGTIGATMFAAQSNEYDVLDAGALAGVAYAWWKSSYIVPWANFFDITPSGWGKDDILPVLLATCSTYPSDNPPNALLCLPLNMAINCMYYNIADWSGAGYSTPLPGTVQLNGDVTPGKPATFDELMPTIKKLNGTSKNAYFVRNDNWFGNLAYGQTNGPWLYGVNWLTKDFTANFTDSTVMEGWNLWLTNSQNYTPDPISMSDMEIGADGSAGQLISGQWTYNAYPGLYGSGSKVTPATFPACFPPAAKNSASFIAGQSPVINAFSSPQQQKAAWSLCSFMSSPRMQAVYNGLGTTGWRPSILTSPAAAAAAKGNYSLQWARAAALELLNGGVMGGSSTGTANLLAGEPLPRNAQAFTIATTCGNELAKVQAGNESLATAMSNLDTAVNALLKQAGVYGTKYPLGT